MADESDKTEQRQDSTNTSSTTSDSSQLPGTTMKLQYLRNSVDRDLLNRLNEKNDD